jgi:membrane protein DedA with SNARE-associated domain
VVVGGPGVLGELSPLLDRFGYAAIGRFLAFNAVGAGLWVGVRATLGYVAGGHIAPVHQPAQRDQRFLLVVLGRLVAALIVWHLLRRRPAETTKP